MRYNNCVQQKPDPSVAIQGNPGFHDFVWPSRARLSLFTAQLTQSVMLLQPMVHAIYFHMCTGTQPDT